MEETISLKDVLATLRKRLWLIVAITLGATVISAVISLFVLTPMYQSTTQILVNQQSETTQYDPNSVRTSLELINTYKVIIQSNTIAEPVAEQVGAGLTAGEVSAKIGVNSQENSQVVEISVKDADPALAASIANTTAKVFQETVPELFGTNVENVSILSEAQAANDPISPRTTLNIAIAFVVGLMAGVGLVYVLDYFDNILETEEDIKRHLELNVLGSVTLMDLEKEAAASSAATRRLTQKEQQQYEQKAQ
ncbi:YveK family protein [Aureibacillus halotolerans]|uniref:Capsular polysaccharide biosynthesis protein n=1 Tax=Aureibacillus halotolerans TaxID=1508390 RepID=A0A4R6TZ81_9BACI|nr:Wzz/FepE/Etk N-terminal domain-containing protein [Aureibacillus halotolerans]TDQ37643.1 capsular polysaccharide biosynthesis protein [Aureibacillus halotolerans]